MSNIIQNTIQFVKEKLEGAEAGHDWFHIERVWKLSKKIAQTEDCNLEVVELSALLHDIADPKFHNGDETLALKISREFLEVRMLKKKLFSRFYLLFRIFHLKIGERLQKIYLSNLKSFKMQTESMRLVRLVLQELLTSVALRII